MTLRVDEADHRLLERAAFVADRPRSELLRDALRWYLGRSPLVFVLGERGTEDAVALRVAEYDRHGVVTLVRGFMPLPGEDDDAAAILARVEVCDALHLITRARVRNNGADEAVQELVKKAQARGLRVTKEELTA
jgi:predicted transcriptional regulator